MQATRMAQARKSKPWFTLGNILTTLVVLFMLFDGMGKLAKPQQVVDAMTKLGFPESQSTGIGIALLICTLVYAIPRTSVFGAILLTAYLGGATASQVRIGENLFPILFPGLIAVLMWAGLYLREDRLRHLVPLRS